MELADLMELAAGGSDRLMRIAEICTQLDELDKQRGPLLAELETLGVRALGVPLTIDRPGAPKEESPLAPNVPRCETCGKEGTEQVDGDWYCETHGDAVVASRMKPPADGVLE